MFKGGKRTEGFSFLIREINLQEFLVFILVS